VKCEGSKGDEERSERKTKQREGVPRRETRDGTDVLEALKRTRGILKIGSS
jgi:hypothetical protein